MQLHFSFIIPVYNRPEEIEELLQSFSKMEGQDYEIVIVEDGSSIDCKEVVQKFSDKLPISYYFKENTGPGDSRNYGMRVAKGNYFIILDSDCILKPDYFKVVRSHLQNNFTDCFGGADTAHENFSSLQKAINFTMTSFITTGGIRGHKKSIQKFEPRSFNMGISKKAFDETGGFSKIHPGEDPDLSQRILKAGLETQFIPNAQVFHKRRISWSKFYTQVKKFGLVRPILNSWHPQSSKITFWFPTLFVFFTMASLLLSFLWSIWACVPLLSYLLLVFFGAALQNKSITIGFLALWAVLIQFFGYGLAFLKSTFYIRFLKKDPKKKFPHLFFK
ncbi:MAG: glycosyl transferase family 2 [Alteromonas sp.]|nr:glycosyl transferase family 2 [Alteromonas sp.]